MHKMHKIANYLVKFALCNLHINFSDILFSQGIAATYLRCGESLRKTSLCL